MVEHRRIREWAHRLALLATLHARPGKESEVEEFLKSAQPLVEQETGTGAGSHSR